MANTFTGKVWKFEHDINTDLVIPNFAVLMTVEEQLQHCFSANRPGWVDEVQPGDVLVVGRNFGVGSARNIGAVFHGLGISGDRRRVVQRPRPPQLHQRGHAVAAVPRRARRLRRGRRRRGRLDHRRRPQRHHRRQPQREPDPGRAAGHRRSAAASRACCAARATSPRRSHDTSSTSQIVAPAPARSSRSSRGARRPSGSSRSPLGRLEEATTLVEAREQLDRTRCPPAMISSIVGPMRSAISASRSRSRLRNADGVLARG